MERAGASGFLSLRFEESGNPQVVLSDGEALGVKMLQQFHCGLPGDAEQFLEVGSTRYSHLLDPRTGWPLTMHRAVSIVAEDAASADALASAVCVLGPVAGPALLVRWPGARILAADLQ